MSKSLQDQALEWASFVTGESLLSWTTIDRPNRDSRIFKIYTSSKMLILMLRLDRNNQNNLQLQSRQKKDIEREVSALQNCIGMSPKLVNYAPEYGALLFDPIPDNYPSLTDLLCESNKNNIDNVIQLPLATLAKIHRQPVPIQLVDSDFMEDLYLHITLNARQLCPQISMPVLSGESVFLHGNPNPGNWKQISQSEGIWLDFEDSYAGIAEFDFGYFLGHLRVLFRDKAINSVLTSLKQINLTVNEDYIIQVSEVVYYYVIATESRYKRYLLVN
ncbi:hypothetical protein [Limnospira maxima]|nr:hypothetical protein [Limnospira maxima]